MNNSNLYVGIDIGYESALISVYQKGDSQVETISTVSGKENYQIPLSIFQTGNGNYYYGSEAIKREHREDGNYYSDIYAEALKEKGSDLYRRLLVVFVRRLLKLAGVTADQEDLFVAITVPEISSVTAMLMEYLRVELRIPVSRFMVLDYAESFYSYVYHQDRSVWIHDVAMFDYNGDHVSFYVLHKSGNGRIHRITCRQTERTIPAYETAGPKEKDRFFAGIISEHLNRQIISSVYLIGDGFDGDWMKETLSAVGTNKRIFVGKNLFTKGAAYAIYTEHEQNDWIYYYDAPYKFKGEVRLKVSHQGKPAYLTLVEAGRSWFHKSDQYRLLYDGEPRMEFQIRSTDNLNTNTQYYELTDLPARPARTIRLSVSVEAFDGYHATIVIKDDGFGDFYAPTGKSWRYDITF